MEKKVAAYSREFTVYRTRSSVIFIGPGLLGYLGRGLCVYNVFDSNKDRNQTKLNMSVNFR